MSARDLLAELLAADHPSLWTVTATTNDLLIKSDRKEGVPSSG